MLASPVIVVLGCRLAFDPASARLRGAALRRATRAAEVYRVVANHPHALVVASGGRAWSGVVEADAIAAELERAGVDRARILRERWSHSTRENAHYSGMLLRSRGVTEVAIVTCDFHTARARLLFEHQGFVVQTFDAPTHVAALSIWSRAYGSFRESVATMIDKRHLAGAAR